MTIEYRLKPVTRYIITRHEEPNGARQVGPEYDTAEIAYHTAYALARQEAEHKGIPPFDERMMYPEYPNEPKEVRSVMLSGGHGGPAGG